MRPSQEFSRICSLDLKGNETLEELRGSLRSWAGGLHVGSTLDKLEARLAGAPQLLQDLRLQLTDFADILDGWTRKHDGGSFSLELAELQDILENLQDLAPALLDSVPHTRNTDPRWKDHFASFQSNVDRLYVIDRFPAIEAHLVNKLGEANRLRRARLAYAQPPAASHSTNAIEQGSPPSRTLEEPVTVVAKSSPSKFHDSGLGPSLVQSNSSQLEVVRSSHVETHETRKLTDDDYELSDAESLATATSYAATEVDNQEGKARRFPAPPPEFYTNTPFACPLCWRHLFNISSTKAWRRHVVQDLEPYLCTHEDCHESRRLYSRRRDWVAHELSSHYTSWECPLCNSAEGRYRSRDALASHLDLQHSDLLTNRQQQDLLPACAFKMAASKSKPTCAMCSSVFNDYRSWAKHVAYKLEEVAIFTTPRQIDIENSSPHGGSHSGSSSVSLNCTVRQDISKATYRKSDQEILDMLRKGPCAIEDYETLEQNSSVHFDSSLNLVSTESTGRGQIASNSYDNDETFSVPESSTRKQNLETMHAPGFTGKHGQPKHLAKTMTPVRVRYLRRGTEVAYEGTLAYTSPRSLHLTSSVSHTLFDEHFQPTTLTYNLCQKEANNLILKSNRGDFWKVLEIRFHDLEFCDRVWAMIREDVSDVSSDYRIHEWVNKPNVHVLACWSSARQESTDVVNDVPTDKQGQEGIFAVDFSHQEISPAPETAWTLQRPDIDVRLSEFIEGGWTFWGLGSLASDHWLRKGYLACCFREWGRSQDRGSTFQFRVTSSVEYEQCPNSTLVFKLARGEVFALSFNKLDDCKYVYDSISSALELSLDEISKTRDTRRYRYNPPDFWGRTLEDLSFTQSNDEQPIQEDEGTGVMTDLSSCFYCRSSEMQCDKNEPSCSNCIEAKKSCRYEALSVIGAPQPQTENIDAERSSNANALANVEGNRRSNDMTSQLSGNTINACVPHTSASSSLVKASSSGFQASSHKSKSRLSKHQHASLEAEFRVDRKPSTTSKKKISEQLEIPLVKINNWFKNRRGKEKYEEQKHKNAKQAWQTDQSGFPPHVLPHAASSSLAEGTHVSETTSHINEYVDRDTDSAGEQKVTSTGHLTAGREYRCRTFRVPGRGDKLFMLATECAKVLRFRHSDELFNAKPSLYKIVLNQAEKDHLINEWILPYDEQQALLVIVPARSVFRQFGASIVQNGRHVRDDYWEHEARKHGFTEEDRADLYVPLRKYNEDDTKPASGTPSSKVSKPSINDVASSSSHGSGTRHDTPKDKKRPQQPSHMMHYSNRFPSRRTIIVHKPSADTGDPPERTLGGDGRWC